ncbi:hypothetical protein Agabi119p4_11077 [Agaricus bisporus var. burnettii]|uniref:Uncharacterized protein n=1 Tax=Agaricus bisporus var. burnettii TaxID=192524 RepID=A0A8H7C1R6_AGABI|nr:hypothetical protein Agabi119p4_11077 [Agaricus bisporus var. burnettii]
MWLTLNKAGLMLPVRTSNLPIASSDVVSTKLVFILPPPNGSRAYQSSNLNSKTGFRDRNTVPTERNVNIENVRGKEHLYKLDEAGFQFHTRPTKIADFRNDEKVMKEYYSESIDVIKSISSRPL